MNQYAPAANWPEVASDRPGLTSIVAIAQPHNPVAPVVPPPVLLPILDASDDMSDTIEQRLLPVAIRAQQGDRAARNALFTAFERKINRMVQRLRIPDTRRAYTGIFDHEDAYQESFIAFCELVEQWSPGVPFGRYILANLPWRIRDAVYRGIGKSGAPGGTTQLLDIYPAPEFSTTDPETLTIIRHLIGSLPYPQDRILYERVFQERHLTEIMIDLRISRRTITRHWTHIRARVAEEYGRALRPAPNARSQTDI